MPRVGSLSLGDAALVCVGRSRCGGQSVQRGRWKEYIISLSVRSDGASLIPVRSRPGQVLTAPRALTRQLGTTEDLLAPIRDNRGTARPIGDEVTGRFGWSDDGLRRCALATRSGHAAHPIVMSRRARTVGRASADLPAGHAPAPAHRCTRGCVRTRRRGKARAAMRFLERPW